MTSSCRIESVDVRPLDLSIHGVRGMAGNVRDWVEGAVEPLDETREQRGGSGADEAIRTRVAYRSRDHRDHAKGHVGFRLVKEPPG